MVVVGARMRGFAEAKTQFAKRAAGAGCGVDGGGGGGGDGRGAEDVAEDITDFDSETVGGTEALEGRVATRAAAAAAAAAAASAAAPLR